MPLRIAKSGAAIATFRIIDIDNDAFTFLTAAGITNTTQRNAINKLVIDLKYYGLWTKQRAIYPVVGGVAASHAVNLKTPGTYNLTFTAGWVHSANGMTPNGTSDYANTGLNSNTQIPTSGHLSYYSRTQTISSNESDIGSIDTGISPNQTCFILSAATSIQTRFGSGLIIATKNTTDNRGFIMSSRLNATSLKLYINGNVEASNLTTNPQVTPNLNIYLGARNFNGTAGGYTTKQLAFASIGDGLTDTDALNFYTIVQRYQTNLSRQV